MLGEVVVPAMLYKFFESPVQPVDTNRYTTYLQPVDGEIFDRVLFFPIG
jgi:hypothetical protein